LGYAPSYGATADAYGHLDLEIDLPDAEIPAGWHLPGQRRALSAPFPNPEPLAGFEINQ